MPRLRRARRWLLALFPLTLLLVLAWAHPATSGVRAGRVTRAAPFWRKVGSRVYLDRPDAANDATGGGRMSRPQDPRSADFRIRSMPDAEAE